MKKETIILLLKADHQATDIVQAKINADAALCLFLESLGHGDIVEQYRPIRDRFWESY